MSPTCNVYNVADVQVEKERFEYSLAKVIAKFQLFTTLPISYPKSGFVITYKEGQLSCNFLKTAGVLSVDPSSITMTKDGWIV